MAEVQQPHKQHIATLPHTTTSSPVTTTPQQLLQKQHNHSKIIKKKRKSHFEDPTSAGWCSSPTLPPAQQLPQRPRSCLMMAEVQQPHKQHVTAHTLNHIRFRRQSQHDVFFALHSLERSKDVIAGSLRAMRPTASCTSLLITSLILAVCRMPVERAMLILLCRALFCCPGAAVFSARWSPSDERS